MKKERKIGKKLIDILMFSMYPDAKIIYREYIQNAYDAIIEAEKRSLLPNISYGNVSVNISSSLRRVSIKDNGTGISKESAATRLLDIADSYKDGVRTAGLYGIGRLVGLRFCEKLIFKTTYQGEDVCTIVKFDSDEARKILDDVNDHRDAVEVIDAISSVEYQAEILEDHYFEVILENVKTEYFSLLDEDVIEDYLREVAPIDYGLVFKNLLLNPALKQQEFKILYDDLNFIQISINDKTDIRKRYEDIIDGTGDKIHSLEFFKLEDINYGLLAWGWYAVTAFSKNIPSSDKNRAIRLRKHNIQIGDSDLLHKFFKEKRGNDYFYGEIHLSHKELRPDTDRTGLVPTPEALRLQELLKEKFIKLDKLYHLASEAKSAIKDIDYGVRKEKDIIDIEEKDVLKTKIEDGLSKLDKVGTKATTFGTDAASKLYEIYKDKAENIVKEPQSNDEKQKLSMPMSTPISVKPPSPIVITDIFEPLKEKFNDSEVKLIRKIFASIRKNCPTANITLIEDIKKKVIKELSK